MWACGSLRRLRAPAVRGGARGCHATGARVLGRRESEETCARREGLLGTSVRFLGSMIREPPHTVKGGLAARVQVAREPVCLEKLPGSAAALARRGAASGTSSPSGQSGHCVHVAYRNYPVARAAWRCRYAAVAGALQIQGRTPHLDFRPTLTTTS